MPSRLSSLLVRDGLVGVKRMEKAFQRQVIYGGSLDTILLEMGLLPDERLTQYLSLASGLPPASRAECNVFDAEAIKRCSEDVALRYRAVPQTLEGDALRVLVIEPVDMSMLEELADTIDMAIQPLIVPEYRWHVVFARAYGTQAPARFTTLAKQIDSAPSTAPVGRARSVIIDESTSAEHVIVDIKTPPPPAAPAAPAAIARSSGDGGTLRPVGPEAVTMRMAAIEAPEPPEAPGAHDEAAEPHHEQLKPAFPRGRTAQLEAEAYQAHLAATEALRRDAEGRRRGVTPSPYSRADTLRDVLPPEGLAEPVPVNAAAAPALRQADIETGPIPTATAIPEPVSAQLTPGDAVIRAPLSTGETSHPEPREEAADAPMTPVAAREALQVADDRDRIFLLLLRALRSRARWAGLLTVQGGAAIGRVAIAEPGVDVASIASVLIPLDVPGAFRGAVLSHRPHVGPVVTGDAEVDAMVERLGGAVPPAALLLPIVLRDRVVALAIAHRLDETIGLADVAELLPLAGVAAEAIGRLIVRHKAAGYRAPTAPGAGIVRVTVDDIQTKRIDAPRPATAWRIPTTQPVVPIELGAETTAPAEPPRPMSEVLDALERADEAGAEPLFAEAIERAGEAVAAIAARFPGALRLARHQISGRAQRAAQYGALLELAVRIGPPVTEVLIEKAGDSSRDVRFYATVCLAELRPRSAVYALVERLFDADYDVRSCAVEALAGYPLRDLDSALARARHALHSDDPERVLAAAVAVAALGDVHAIPDLLDTVARDSRRAEHARRALVALTKQDFGTSERKWRRWWEDHRGSHRVEWLIDGLTHKDAAIRQAAIDELRRMTGEHLGYKADLARRDRETLQQRWRTWWQDQGRARFVQLEEQRRTSRAFPVPTPR